MKQKLILIVVANVLIATAVALAQQQPTSMETALGNKLMLEINAGLQCSASEVSVKTQLDKALARIKELEAKEPSDAK